MGSAHQLAGAGEIPRNSGLGSERGTRKCEELLAPVFFSNLRVYAATGYSRIFQNIPERVLASQVIWQLSVAACDRANGREGTTESTEAHGRKTEKWLMVDV